MMEPTAHAVSQVDLERLFYEALEHCQFPDVQHELRFYKEQPEHMQTQPDLRRRIDKVLRKKEVSDSRKAHEKFLHDALSLGPGRKQPRGQAGKQEQDGQKADKQPKKTATKDAKGASGGGDGGN